MHQAVITPQPVSVERGPSWDGNKIKEPVWVSRHFLAPQHEEAEHPLSRYQFIVHLGSPTEVETHQNGKRVAGVLHFGDLTWTPAGDSCRGIWHQIREAGFVTLSAPFLESVADEIGVSALPNQTILKLNDPLMRELVLALLRNGGSDRLYRESLGNTLAVHLLKATAERNKRASSVTGKLSSRQLHRAIDYLEAKLSEEIDLKSWAREVGLSPYHFARLFKKTTGLAPHQFVLHRRIERAKSILAASDIPLSSVAYDLGFANQSHFNRVFRQYVQMTPGEWRASVQ